MTDLNPYAPSDPTAPSPNPQAYPAPVQPGHPPAETYPPTQSYPPAPGYPGAPGYPATPGYPPAAAYPGYPSGDYAAPVAAYPGYGYPAPVKTNGLAIAAMVCALAGVVTCVSAPVGAILGHVARRQIRERGEGGDGMALAGIIVGWILTALLLGYLAFVVIMVIIGTRGGFDDPYALGALLISPPAA